MYIHALLFFVCIEYFLWPKVAKANPGNKTLVCVSYGREPSRQVHSLSRPPTDHKPHFVGFCCVQFEKNNPCKTFCVITCA
jgi:hypothetical protein